MQSPLAATIERGQESRDDASGKSFLEWGSSRTVEAEWCRGGMRQEAFSSTDGCGFEVAKAIAHYVIIQEKEMRDETLLRKLDARKAWGLPSKQATFRSMYPYCKVYYGAQMQRGTVCRRNTMFYIVSYCGWHCSLQTQPQVHKNLRKKSSSGHCLSRSQERWVQNLCASWQHVERRREFCSLPGPSEAKTLHSGGSVLSCNVAFRHQMSPCLILGEGRSSYEANRRFRTRTQALREPTCLSVQLHFSSSLSQWFRLEIACRQPHEQ